MSGMDKQLNTAEFFYWEFFEASVADMRRMLKTQVDFILYFAKTDLRASDSGEYFDEERADLVKMIDRQFSYNVKEMGVNAEKLITIICSTYAKLSRGLLAMAGEAQDKELANSYLATAWSVLAKDASGILSRNTNYVIDQDWKDKLWKSMKTAKGDENFVAAELKKFEDRDPGIFKLKSESSLDPTAKIS